MKRRDFLKTSAVLTTAAIVPMSGCSSAPAESRLDLATMVEYLNQLKLKTDLAFSGPWPAFATFTHLAQSVEYSMTGFPEHKSDGFKSWVGGPAFWVFKQAGAMRHDTAEAIPGAPDLDVLNRDPIAINQSITRLIEALSRFAEQSESQPHFAYGALSQEDYMLAHLMHINDHLDLLEAA